MINPQHHSVAWTDGHLELVVNFDHQAVESELDGVEVQSDETDAMARMLSRIIVWIWGRRIEYKAALNRLVSLTAGLRPDILQNRSYLELGRMLGCTKQNLSRTALMAQKEFGVKFARSRQEEHRRVMSERAKGHKPTHTGGKRIASRAAKTRAKIVRGAEHIERERLRLQKKRAMQKGLMP